MGASSFFNAIDAGNLKGPFQHDIKLNAHASLTVLGMDLSGMLNFTLLDEVESIYAWQLDYNDDYPPEWNESEYSSIRLTSEIPYVGSLRRTFYDSDWNLPQHSASGVVRINSTANENAYLLVSGINKQAALSNEYLGKYVLATMLRTLFDAGLYSAVEDKMPQVPSTAITVPSATAEITGEWVDVSWGINWKRWDGLKYTFEYPGDYEDTATENDLIHHMKYSNDNGATWKFCYDSTVTKIGERSSDPNHIINYQDPITETWDIPTAQYPEGIYLLRIETFRNSVASHYSYDQQRIYIKR
jgi:hypothetical protein